MIDFSDVSVIEETNDIRVSFKDSSFISKAKSMDNGVIWKIGDEEFEVTSFDKPTNFPWQQRIFPPGVILHKIGTHVRIFIEK